ncbi:WD40 repeat-like protein [Metschnikowia bicuspidata var. bicuspidata NRRL YB-4993]|uniref:WD40 repeat-like protein n=1 Tax=Metschnikowia bicuspidata var. bicuspidata NRRL YB-4993 TaxID=869754 RepID=A0A1A0HBI6_9ASCO|nr:WD40 repeat-like protein [Metschnikowia bicuspidata var. bicuspidata NRRL YB-4993]OBA21248.1 WD40 repeat-like protein [Metschnikowia bicuspidata var. bicuspidata NRRL YB-4993]
MSLASAELNYLIWRYLQESGFDLAAYAFQKDSACLDYEYSTNRLLPAIQPGCLVNLVQKGMLYTFLEDSAAGKPLRLNLVDSVLKDKTDFDAAQGAEWARAPGARPNPSAPAGTDTDTPDVAMQDARGPEAPGALAPPQPPGPDLPFQTAVLRAFAACAPSLLLHWHPSTDVLALGTERSTAVIHALGAAGIAETVTLSHPPTMAGGTPVPSAVCAVSWSPQGSLVLTAGAGGEIRAWAPDGRLKNIVNSVASSEGAPAGVHALVWNTSGLLVLSISSHNCVGVWEGATLAPVLQWAEPEPASGETHACWLGELKFAMTTRKHGIRIVAVNAAQLPAEALLAVGQLPGHTHSICDLCFSPVSKLLASASDVDYAIKVWNSLLSEDALELNVAAERLPGLLYHTLPIVALAWLSRAGDVQGNELLSVSMEGSVNVWDAFSGDALVSANVFKNPDNFEFPEDQPDVHVSTKNSLVYAAAVAPNSRVLALGDDSGNVTIWDIHPARYRGTREFLRCLGLFAADSADSPDVPVVGICDLVWDSKSRFLTVCYKGRESVILLWDKS